MQFDGFISGHFHLTSNLRHALDNTCIKRSLQSLKQIPIIFNIVKVVKRSTGFLLTVPLDSSRALPGKESRPLFVIQG